MVAEARGMEMVGFLKDGKTAEDLSSEIAIIRDGWNDCERPGCIEDLEQLEQVLLKNIKTSLEVSSPGEELERDGKGRTDQGYLEWMEWHRREEATKAEKEERLKTQKMKKEYWDLHRECTLMMDGNKSRWLERQKEENKRRAEEEKLERLRTAKSKTDSSRKKAKAGKKNLEAKQMKEDSRRLEKERKENKKRLLGMQKIKESLWKQRREKDGKLITLWKTQLTGIKPSTDTTSLEEETLEASWLEEEINDLGRMEREALEELEKKRCQLERITDSGKPAIRKNQPPGTQSLQPSGKPGLDRDEENYWNLDEENLNPEKKAIHRHHPPPPPIQLETRPLMHAPAENTLVMHAPKNKHTAKTFPTPRTDRRVQVMHGPENTHTHTHPHTNLPTPHLDRGVELRTDYPINETILGKREQGRDMVGLDIAKECEQKKREHTMLRASTFGTVGPPDYSTSKATTDKREQGRDMVDRIIDKGLEQRKRLVRNIDIDCKEERKKNEKIESEEEEDKKNGSQEIQDWKISLGKTTDGSPRRVRMTSMRTRMGSPKDLERLKPGMKTKVAKLPLSLSPSKVIDGTGLSSMKHLIKTRENRISLEDTVLTFSKTRKPRLDPKQELTNGIRVKKTFAGKLGTG